MGRLLASWAALMLAAGITTGIVALIVLSGAVVAVSVGVCLGVIGFVIANHWAGWF